ncbi:MAG: ABC transporter permease [Treponema sp.]|nr:ABC transporter permease [Treponema sp.]
MEKAITISGLAFSNIKRKPFRTFALILISALSAGVLFATLILASSLEQGIKGFQNRLGADLMIVPQGNENKFENVLLTGEPNYFYMNRSIEDLVRGVQGVSQVSSQFYLTSLNESCCDFSIQIIGFDPQTDFIIQNWAGKKIEKNKDDELLLTGSNVTLSHNQVTFFGQTHKVTARLAKSNTGMDNAIYTDLKTLQKIFEASKEKGFGFISDGDTSNKTSTIFVKLAKGASADGTSLRIKNAVGDGIEVVQGDKFLSSLEEKISGFLIFPKLLSVFTLLISSITLALVFSLIANERKREYSILRVLGADSSALSKLILFEAAGIGAIGALSGIFVAALIVLPFNFVISEKIALPLSLESPVKIILLALISLVIIVFSSLLAAAFSAVKISKQKVIFK